MEIGKPVMDSLSGDLIVKKMKKKNKCLYCNRKKKIK